MGRAERKSKPIDVKEALARQTEWLHRIGVGPTDHEKRGVCGQGNQAKVSALDPTQPASLALSWWRKATAVPVCSSETVVRFCFVCFSFQILCSFFAALLLSLLLSAVSTSTLVLLFLRDSCRPSLLVCSSGTYNSIL
jgi:hypothetical protein